MVRNKNIETVRAFAIIGILVYHYGVTIGIAAEGSARLIVEFLAQSVLCTFFVISGFGTYLFLKRHEQKNGHVDYWAFIKRRVSGIVPAYYFCIFAIVLTTGAYYLSDSTWTTIPVYLTFTQNLFPKHIGLLNGATWTMALMMQFYLIAPFLYKFVKRWQWKSIFVVAFISVSARFLIDKYIQAQGYEDLYYIIANIRQLITTLDIFCAGMCAAHYAERQNGTTKMVWQRSYAPILLILVIAIYTVLYQSALRGGLWNPNSIMAFFWESIIGILIAMFCCLFYHAPITYNSIPGKVVTEVARIEYNTYLWHMIILTNVSGSEWYQRLQYAHPVLLMIIMMFVALGVGKTLTTLFMRDTVKSVR